MSPRIQRQKRIPFRARIEYDGIELFHPDWSLNLSIGGLFILTTKPLPAGETLLVEFEIPELRKIIKIEGKVVWTPTPRSADSGKSHPQGMAIAFDSIDPDLKRILDQYVTVSFELSSVDTRIGKELPSHVRKELPDPGHSETEILDDMTPLQELYL